MKNLTIKTQIKEFTKGPGKVLIILIGIDILFVVLHVIFRSQLLDLDGELNIPTYYQSVKLFSVFLVGLIYLLLVKYKKFPDDKHVRFLTIILMIGALFLSYDEIMQFHETIVDRLRVVLGMDNVSQYEALFYERGYSASNWMIFYLPAIFIFVSVFGFLAVKMYKKIKNELPIILIVALLFTMVFVVEYLGTAFAHTLEAYQVFMIIEESCELLGGSFLLFYMARKLILLLKRK